MPRYNDEAEDVLDDDVFDERGILRDGRRYRVPANMMDAIDRTVRDRVAAEIRPRYSAAFPRPKRGPLITDQFGGTLGLHRPGPRIESGGNRGDQLVRDGARDEIQRAHDEYRRELENAWRDALADPDEQPQRDISVDDAENAYAEYDAWIEQQWQNNK